MPDSAADAALMNMVLTAIALALACALLSVIVVLRRWAFIGEGISHSGFGGAGTAWILMLFVPALNQPWVPYVAVILFCLITAIAIGAISRGQGVNIDAAIGIFLVASLAWGFLGQQIYMHRRGVVPTLFDNLLFGQAVGITAAYTRAAIATCLAVVVIMVGLWKEILAYGFDPELAATAGVPARLVHYLLMLLIALVVVVGMRLVGSVLVTALLILPGATALLLSRKLVLVLFLAVVVAMIGTVGGVLLGRQSQGFYLPAGPVIVLIMFVQFLLAYSASALRKTAV